MHLPMFKRPGVMPSLGVPEEPQMSTPMVMNRDPEMSSSTPFQAPQISPIQKPQMPMMPRPNFPPPSGNTPPILGGQASMPRPGMQQKRPIIRPSLGGLRPPNRFGAGRPY